MSRIYTDQEAEIYGRRRVCAEVGHDLFSRLEMSYQGGVQMQYDRKPGQRPATCDEFKCRRCDAVFVVTYPEIGIVQ